MRLDSSLKQLLNVAHYLTPRRPGRLHLRGLRNAVQVHTDKWGVPHVYATHRDDLFFAQGYLTARDRLFQIDYNRHAAGGRLCELLGRRPIPWRETTVHLKERTTYDVDVLLRTFGLERAAQASLAAHSDEAHSILAAYTAGINACIEQGHRTLEHRLLGLSPAPWQAQDSILMFKAVAFELNFAWRAILLSTLLGQAKVPDDVARTLWPHAPRDGSYIVEDTQLARAAHDLTLVREAADAAIGIGNATGVGSNCFAVAGSHTQDGAALLANDTHLAMVAPSPWYEIGLHGAGFDLHGYALAGVPGIGIGRTPHHAWGITAGLVHDLDLFSERLNPEDPEQYLTPAGWKKLESRKESIVVRGEGRHERTIYESHHGPLLETLATEAAAGERLAIAWTGHGVGRELDALLAVWQAKTFEACHEGLQHHMCPTYNITYAGADGRVAYFLAGAVPKRRADTPLRPLEGWTGEWDWQGITPREDNPAQVAPACGFVVTANNRIAGPDYPHTLGELFEPAGRFERIRERLAALGTQVTYDDLVAIQRDTYSAWGLEARTALFSLVAGPDGLWEGSTGNEQHLLREAAHIWARWDGHAFKESAGAAIGFMAAFNTGRALVRRLAGDDAALAFLEMTSFICQPILELPALAPRLAELGIDLAAVVREGFAQAVATCRTHMGDTPGDWRWGGVHTLTCRHRLHASPLGRFFSLGPEPADGGPDTVNRGDIDGANSFRLRVGAAMRMVVSARDVDLAGTILPGGQSGNRLSPHYDDQLRHYLSGVLKAAPMHVSAEQAASRQELLPKTS